MIFKNFRFQVTIRLLLLLFLAFSAIFIWHYTHFWLVSFWLLLFVVILSLNLIRYVERTDRELVLFLEALKQSDFSLSYNYKKKSLNNRIYNAFHGIMEALQRLSFEKEANHLYLQTVVEHTDMALICFDGSGKILLANTAAKRLLEKPRISNIQSLKLINPNLGEALESLRPGKSHLIKYIHKGAHRALTIQSSKFILKEKEYTIVTLRDIKNELEQQEVESWQKLTRVLTHEIMNSVIPISNLIQIINELVSEKMLHSGPTPLFSKEEMTDISYSLETIEKRSKGLAHFVKGYKKFTQLPQPNLKQINVPDLIYGVDKLLRRNLEEKNIRLIYPVLSEDLFICGDPELLEQVLINIIQNAADALQNTPGPVIEISTKEEADFIMINIKDNGPGIDEEILDQIFIPFFTTKIKGSGVGLSISNQIMQLHGGNLKVTSQKGKGSEFSLKLIK